MLHWKRRPVADFPRARDVLTWNKRWAGKVAGSPHYKGYRTVVIDGQKFYEHRVVYCIVHGVDPGPFRVDHRDHDEARNAPKNLRLLTNSANIRRREKLWAHNKSGVTGVSRSSNGQRWVARITVDGEKKNLGSFVNFADAVDARREAERKYNDA